MAWHPDDIAELRKRLSQGVYRTEIQKGTFPTCAPDVDRMSNERREAFDALKAQADELRRLRSEAAFLLDRLSEWSADNLTDEGARDWFGHIEPSIERMRSMLSAPVMDAVKQGDA